MMKKRISLVCACLISGLCVFGQTSMNNKKPKLIVGVVVDQMRWDYLHRFSCRFTDGGFKRLMNEGFSCDNTQLNYIPTITAVGHTSIYTGSVPAINGIAGNNFYKNGVKVYCTDDATVEAVGSSSKEGKMSPRNLLVTTIGDELKLSNNFKSKVVGVSLKDRASILPAGHTADAAYWFDDMTGKFISSSFYMDNLPTWVDDFNKLDMARTLMKNDWNTLYPIESYTESTADNTKFENAFFKGENPVFPIRTSELMKAQGYKAIRTTPYGNTITLEMAKAALDGEKLGQEDRTDMLAVSLSSTDYIGHRFGTYAIETADTYYRLDKDLEDFISYLDKKVGRDNYILFLTADHAATHNFLFLNHHNIPGDGWDVDETEKDLNAHLKHTFKVDNNLIKEILNYQVYMDKEQIKKLGLDLNKVKDETCSFLLENPLFAWVLDMNELNTASVPEPVRERAVNGYNRFRSGDIQLIMQPGCYNVEPNKGLGGTDHGVWNPYDAHIPLLFIGANIEHGSTYDLVNMTDIAPTICAMLGIQAPNGCIGKAIRPILDNKRTNTK